MFDFARTNSRSGMPVLARFLGRAEHEPRQGAEGQRARHALNGIAPGRALAEVAHPQRQRRAVRLDRPLAAMSGGSHYSLCESPDTALTIGSTTSNRTSPTLAASRARASMSRAGSKGRAWPSASTPATKYEAAAIGTHREQARQQRIAHIVLARPDQHVANLRMGAIGPGAARRNGGSQSQRERGLACARCARYDMKLAAREPALPQPADRLRHHLGAAQQPHDAFLVVALARRVVRAAGVPIRRCVVLCSFWLCCERIQGLALVGARFDGRSALDALAHGLEPSVPVQIVEVGRALGSVGAEPGNCEGPANCSCRLFSFGLSFTKVSKDNEPGRRVAFTQILRHSLEIAARQRGDHRVSGRLLGGQQVATPSPIAMVSPVPSPSGSG